MDEENKNKNDVAPGQDAMAPPVEERPNRKAFAERFGKRHKDIDFEDKEARYGAMMQTLCRHTRRTAVR